MELLRFTSYISNVRCYRYIVDIEACNKIEPVDCVWNPWNIGGCSTPCGDGTRVNTRTKKVHEKHGGKCSGPSKEAKACKEKECSGI